MPRESCDVISPGTASTSRPSSSARSAVISAPLRSRASTTTVTCASPATILFRAGKRHGAGSTPGGYSETIQTAARDLGCERRVRARVVAVDPHPSTASVAPRCNAPRCAAASTPRARPEMTSDARRGEIARELVATTVP